MTAIRLRPMGSTFAMILFSIAAVTVNPFVVGSSPLIFPTITGTMEPCFHSSDTGLLKETASNFLFPASVSPITEGYLNIKVRYGKG